MRITDGKPSRTAPRDAGTAAFVLWIIVFTVFMVALMALDGDRLTTAHHIAASVAGIGLS